jgi:hypothetical protein
MYQLWVISSCIWWEIWDRMEHDRINISFRCVWLSHVRRITIFVNFFPLFVPLNSPSPEADRNKSQHSFAITS